MDTIFTILAVIFVAGMLVFLKKAAKFINEQPKLRMQQMQDEAEKKKKDEENA